MNLHAAAEQVGVPYRTAARWFQLGLIQVEGHANVQGSPVPIGKKELRELKWLVKLRGKLPMQVIRSALAYLRSIQHNPLSTGQFIVSDPTPGNRHLIKICDGGKILELIGKHQGQQLMFISLDDEM